MTYSHTKTHTFRDIKAWQLARELRIEIYRISRRFPKEETFCLTSQIRRSAISIHANIAEGYGRYNFQENIQFCRIARGSTDEVLDELLVAFDENYISEEEYYKINAKGEEIKKAINGYVSFLQNQKSKY